MKWQGFSRAACMGALSLLTVMPGCAVAAGDGGGGPIYAGPVDGRLTLRWSVDETTDPHTCAMGIASVIDVQVLTSAGLLAGEYQAACESFATSIAPLAPGPYTANARLLDGAGQARTTPVAINPFTIRPGEELIIDVDFPADSFLF